MVARPSAIKDPGYYLRASRDEYFLGSGEPPGWWWGRGAAALGLKGQVKAEDFLTMFPEEGPLGTQIVFSAPKPVTMLFAVGDEAMQREVRAIWRESAEFALSHMEDTFRTARRGKAGCIKETADLTVSMWEHCTSRPVDGHEADPQGHIHAVWHRPVLRSDGTWGQSENKDVFVHQRLLGSLFRSHMTYLLETRLRISTERLNQEFTIAAVPQELVKENSKRRTEIKAELKRSGRTDGKASTDAAVSTRGKKKLVNRSELHEEWQRRGRRHGFGPEEVNALCKQNLPARDVGQEIAEVLKEATSVISKLKSHWSFQDYLRYAAEASQCRGVAGPVLVKAVREHLAIAPDIIQLGERNSVMRYSCKETLVVESWCLGLAEKLASNRSHQISQKTIEKVLASKPTITDEQRNAFHYIVSGSGQVACAQGKAGVGKSYMTRAVREAFEMEGMKVYGCAISRKAASNLEESSGIRSTSIARLIGSEELGFTGDLEKDWKQDVKHHFKEIVRAATGRQTSKNERIRLDSKSVLVVDEAGMCDVLTFAKLLAHAERTGTKIICIGDNGQLRPISVGAPFLHLCNKLGAPVLEREIKRQVREEDKQVVRWMSQGKTKEALQSLSERGRIHLAEGKEATIKTLVSKWVECGGLRRPEEHLCLAGTREEVRSINAAIQSARKEAGRLGKKSIELAEGVAFVGDRIVFNQNSNYLGVSNGDTGTVIGIDGPLSLATIRQKQHRSLSGLLKHLEQAHRIGPILRIKLDSGKVVAVSLQKYGKENLSLSYALTTHRAQGLTTANCHVLAGSMQDAELSYVQLSRAKHETHVYCEASQAGEGLSGLIRMMSRSRQEDLATDVLREATKLSERHSTPEQDRGHKPTPGISISR